MTMTEQAIEHMNEPLPGTTEQSGFGRWYDEGMRTAVFLAPRWNGLRAQPASMALLTAAGVLLTLMVERLYIPGQAGFYWQAVAGGWFTMAVVAWICYLLRPQPLSDVHGDAAPSAAHLFCLTLAQTQVMTLAVGVLYAVLIHSGKYTEQTLGAWGMWAAWLLPLSWGILAELTLFWRGGSRRRGPMLVAALALVGTTALYYVAHPAEFWYPLDEQDEQAQRKQLQLTQEAMEAQPQLLAQRLQEIAPQRPGIIDLYSISFAPYASEDVFKRESAMVSDVMAQRFDARGRTLQLVNHVDTAEQWPWATPLNLQRAIQHIAGLMNRSEDVLFLHLTSHGARDGELAAQFWPMSVGSVKPDQLKAWLDEAGIRYSVMSISACYSGSWIAPLATPDTLVMTAADAEHTSYGCGRKSELTYFGRAMYDEQLRKETLSFTAAHTAAREIIRKREDEAGKDDGYSNPQIAAGEGIQAQLARLEKRLASK